MFQGAITAIVTPFTEEGKLDKNSLRNLVEFQIKNQIDGIVPCGTTGEGSTLEPKEHETVIEIVLEVAKGKVPVIASTGGNFTKEAIEKTKWAAQAGADASLQICPYYTKPTQDGLYKHFSSIADAVDIPIVIYNIPGRTAVNLETSTLVRLVKEHANIVGVKEASGSLPQMMEEIANLPQSFAVLSGDDNLTLPLMAMGGKGVVSVASNLIPQEMHELTQLALNGKFDKAREIHYRLLPLFQAIFIETNPIPIKAALAMKGLIKESYRLPMCQLKPENREKLKKILRELKII